MPVTLDHQTVTPVAPEAATAETQAPTLQDLLRAFRADCLLEPERYVGEVHVPFGGE